MSPSRRSSIRRLLCVTGGQLAAPAASLLALPLLLALYDLAAVGEFFLLASIAMCLAAVVAMGLTVAIALETDAAAARRLLAASSVTGLLLAAAIVAAAAPLQPWLLPEYFGGALLAHAACAAVLVASINVTSLVAATQIQRGRFAPFAAVKLMQATLCVGGQVLAAQVGIAPVNGLIVGYTAGFAAAAAFGFVIEGGPAGLRDLIAAGPIRSTAAVLRGHRDSIRYTGPSDLLVRFGTEFPGLLLASAAGPIFAGLYGIATRLLSSPGSLVGTTAARLFLADLTRVDPSDAMAKRRLCRRYAGGIAALLGLYVLALLAAAPLLESLANLPMSRVAPILLLCGPFVIAQIAARAVLPIFDLHDRHRDRLRLTVAAFAVPAAVMVAAVPLGGRDLGLLASYALVRVPLCLLLLAVAAKTATQTKPAEPADTIPLPTQRTRSRRAA